MSRVGNETGLHQVEQHLGNLQNVLRNSRETAEKNPSETAKLLMAVRPFMPWQMQKNVDDVMQSMIMMETLKNIRNSNQNQPSFEQIL